MSRPAGSVNKLTQRYLDMMRGGLLVKPDITVAELAEKLSIHPKTVERWVPKLRGVLKLPAKRGRPRRNHLRTTEEAHQ
jgi:transposase